jgi:two-component system sensor histidine kinase SenX3
LSIVRHVVVNHGGEVSVSSVEGEGSTFTLRLPAAPVAGIDRGSGGEPAGRTGRETPVPSQGEETSRA